jgi:hypothetical protein
MKMFTVSASFHGDLQSVGLMPGSKAQVFTFHKNLQGSSFPVFTVMRQAFNALLSVYSGGRVHVNYNG